MAKTKTKRPVKKAAKKVPTAADIKAMKEKLKSNVDKAQEALCVAENRLDYLRAELECQEEFFDDAEGDLFDAEGDLSDFDEMVKYAKETGDWLDVIHFSPSL